MNTAHISRIAVVLTAALTLATSACASAEGDGNGANADARLDGDGAPIPDPPDANPNAPDANPNTGGPDANNAGCVKPTCDLVPQCGCPSDQACDLDGTMLATGGTECRGVNAQGQEASTCTNPEDCAAEYVCLGGATSQCRHYCTGDADCPGDGSLCLIQITYSGGDVPGAKTCSKACPPAATANPTGCPPNYACHIFLDDPDGSLGGGSGETGDERFLTDCLAAGAGTHDADCSANGMSDCAAGYDCVTIGGNDRCRQTCAYPGGTCATGSCARYAAPRPVIGAQEYGVCN